MQAFLQCSNCKKTLFSLEFEQNLRVCQHCGHHHRLPARTRVAITFDEGSFQEFDADLASTDPLNFPDYEQKLTGAVAKMGVKDSALCGLATLDGRKVSVAVADFSFMGGSMGTVNGEKIARALERGVDERCPVVIFCASGGARMQEGLLSLMQMAKTTAAVNRCNDHGVPFLAVFTDPTMAGVLASYASVADVILAEPKALIGFAGARVSKQAGVHKVPDDFQTAEYMLKHGMLDRIVHRKDLPRVLSDIVAMLGGHLATA